MSFEPTRRGEFTGGVGLVRLAIASLGEVDFCIYFETCSPRRVTRGESDSPLGEIGQTGPRFHFKLTRRGELSGGLGRA
jgi:hypothetical protein